MKSSIFLSFLTPLHSLFAVCAVWVGAMGMTTNALADSGSALPRVVPPIYSQECASCHVGFPPGMLSATSWQRIMKGLDKHFGTDASLDAPTHQAIANWLQTHAGTYRRVSESSPEDRITRSAWFERKHRKIDATVWTLPSVKTAANCAACHRGAEKGFFDDDDLIYPAGLSATQRKSWRH